MLERKTIVDRIEIDSLGNIAVRLGLLIVDGDEEIDRKPHRLMIEPGDDVAARLDAVSDGLKGPAVESTELLDSIVSLVHTPDVVKAAQDARLKAQAEAMAQGRADANAKSRSAPP